MVTRRTAYRNILFHFDATILKRFKYYFVSDLSLINWIKLNYIDYVKVLTCHEHLVLELKKKKYIDKDFILNFNVGWLCISNHLPKKMNIIIMHR